MIHLGDFPTSATMHFKWQTNAAAGESITRSTDGTLKIYKGSSTTERSSLNGVTQTEDFDSATGIHHVTIDLSDNTDSGFYAAGQEYQVVMTGMTIDTKTVNAVIAHFSIERAGGILALLKDATYGLAALETLVDDVESRLGTPTNLGGGATIAANLADIEAQTDDIGSAGAGLSAVPWNSAWDAEVQSEVDDALVAQNLDHLVKIAVDTDFATTVHLNSVVGHLADNGTSATFDRTTDSLEAVYNKAVDVETDTQDLQSKLGTPSNLGGGATVAANLADIEAQTDDIGTAGAGLTAVPWNSSWDAEVQSEVADALDAAIPGSPTAHSINERVKTMDDAYTATRAGYLDNINNSALQTTTAQTGDSYARLGAPTNLGSGATIAANLVDIEAQTDDIGPAGAGLTAVPWNASWDAEVQSEVQDALEVNNLDHLVKAAVDTDFATTVHLNSVVGHLADNGTSASFDRTTESAEALRDRGDAAWLQGATPAQVNTECDTALADVGLTTTITGRIDAAMSTRASQTSLDTLDDLVDTEVAAIKAKTDNLPTDPADESSIQGTLSIMAAYIDTEVAAIKAKTDLLSFTSGRVHADAQAISGSTESADRLERATLAICTGTVGSGSTTTSIVTSSLSPSVAVTDQLKGRIICFDHATSTTALRGQATDITASSSGGVLTCTALTTAPSSGDTFTVT